MNGRRFFAPSGAVLETDAGQGNLSAKAYIAALVGPYRVVFGKSNTYTLEETSSTQLLRNAGRSDQFAFCSVTLPVTAAGVKYALFGSSESLGPGTDLAVELDKTLGPFSGHSFAAILAPGDMLYARSASGQGEFKVIVNAVWF